MDEMWVLRKNGDEGERQDLRRVEFLGDEFSTGASGAGVTCDWSQLLGAGGSCA